MSNLTFTVKLDGPAGRIIEIITEAKHFFAKLGVDVELEIIGSIEVSEIASFGRINMDTPLEELFPRNLEGNERPLNCLQRVRINTLGELLQRHPDDLLAITNFGQKSLHW